MGPAAASSFLINSCSRTRRIELNLGEFAGESGERNNNTCRFSEEAKNLTGESPGSDRGAAGSEISGTGEFGEQRGFS